MNALWFLINSTLAIAISYGASLLVFHNADPSKRFLAAVAGFPVVAVGAVLLTGAFGVLSSPSVALLLFAVILAGWSIPGVRKAILHNAQTNPGMQESPVPAPEPELIGLAAAVTVAFFGVPLVRALFAGLNFGVDDLTYHAPAFADWVTQHGIVLSPFDYHAYYSFNAEALAAWCVLPFHTDGLVGMAGAFWLGLLWLASARLVMLLGGNRIQALIAASLVTAAPVVATMAARVSSPDIAGTAMIFSATTFLAPDNKRSPAVSVGSAAYAGGLLGFALGCKVSFGLVLFVVLCWVLFSRSLATNRSDRLRIAAIIFLTSMITGGAWYVRNLVLTGNPVFPAQLGPFAGPFTQADQSRTKLISWILERPMDLTQWSAIVSALCDWPPSLFALSFAGYIWGIWQLLRSKLHGHRSPLQTLLLLIGLVVAVSYFIVPFSATYNEEHGLLTPQIRFVITSYVVGVLLFCSIPATTYRRRLFVVIVALMALIPAWSGKPMVGLVLVVSGMALPFVVHLFESAFTNSHMSTPRWMWVGVAIGVAGLAFLQPVIQRATDQRVYEFGQPNEPIGQAWKAVAALPSGARIAWFANSPQEYYPLFGRHLNLVPVPLNQDGTPCGRLHTLFAESGGAISWWGGEPAPTSEVFLENLKKAHVDFVLVSKWHGPAWPAQENILSGSGAWKSTYEDGYSTLWKASGATTF